jgi:hypothetical protein
LVTLRLVNGYPQSLLKKGPPILTSHTRGYAGLKLGKAKFVFLA